MIQIVMTAAAVLSFVGGSAAFLLVIWPSIRNAERRAVRFESWLASSEGEAMIKAVKAKVIGPDVVGRPLSRNEFLREADPAGPSEETVRL